MIILGVTQLNWQGIAALSGKQNAASRSFQALQELLGNMDVGQLISMTTAFAVDNCDDALLLAVHFNVQLNDGWYICTGSICRYVDFVIRVMTDHERCSQYMLQEANYLFAALLRFNRNFFDNYRTCYAGNLKYLVKVK